MVGLDWLVQIHNMYNTATAVKASAAKATASKATAATASAATATAQYGPRHEERGADGSACLVWMCGWYEQEKNMKSNLTNQIFNYSISQLQIIILRYFKMIGWIG